MLTLRQITLSRGNKILLENASTALHDKQKIGLVGHNGCGKSSLFALILGELTADAGECLMNSQLRISHLSQQLPDSNQLALDFVLAGDEDYIMLQQRLASAEHNQSHDEVLLCHELLTQTGGYSKPAKAASIMAGLGFKAEEQKNRLTVFQGAGGCVLAWHAV